MSIPFIEENDQTIARKQHLAEMQQLVGNVYPNKFDRSNITGKEDTITQIVSFEPVISLIPQIAEGEKPIPEIKEAANANLQQFGSVRIAGRLATPPRIMGKAAFVHLSDGVKRLQIYVRRDDVKGVANDGKESEANGWEMFKLFDHGDIVGVEGFLFLTNTGELSVHVERLQFLSKAMLPMPDKIHGISDPELQRRFRYADLIADSLKIDHAENELTTREVFERRAKLISGMRRFLDDAGFIEVETPMLTPKATGAAAKPFETHHDALGIPLYARIAPELYLKRLTVGGFEKVYELNRNFRNEGLSFKHNPEFTMLEFYYAYMDVNGMMDFGEAMIKESVQKATGGSLQVKYGESEIDFSKFERISMKEAIHRDLSFNIEAQQRQIEEGENPEDFNITFSDLIGEKYDISWLDNPQKLRALVIFTEKNKSQKVSAGDNKVTGRLVSFSREQSRARNKQILEKARKLWQEASMEMQKTFDAAKNQTEQTARDLVYIFEDFVEEKLIHPTFIIDYPKAISPLSKASPQNPQIAERFELFIYGMECANGFSELNDPAEQYERFLDQAKERESGDEEAMVLDVD